MNSLGLGLKNCVFLFQGVGNRYHDLVHLFNDKQLLILKEYCERAKKEMDLDLWDYIISGSNEEYDEKFYDWVMIYTCDCIIYDEYISLGLSPSIMMGYSMGITTALTCSKAITYETGLQFLKCTYLYREGTNSDEESMGAIIGYHYEHIMNFIKEHNLEGKVMISSENNETCIGISGIRHGVKKILEVCRERGAIKAFEVNAPYAFHSRYSEKNIEVFRDLVSKSNIQNSKIPIFSVYSQAMLIDQKDIRRELVKNMYTPMKWKESMLMLGKQGMNDYVEVSLSQDITRMSRVIDLNYKFHTYKRIMGSLA